MVKTDYDTLQPRVGFSEDVFGNGKTVLRGGFGTFYERLQGNDIYDVATAAPFANTPSANTVYLSDPHTSYVTGAAAATPFFAQGSTTSRTELQGACGCPVQPRRSESGGSVGHLGCSVCRQFGLASEHSPQHQQLPDQHLTASVPTQETRVTHSGTNPGGTTIADQTSYVPSGFGGITEQENNTNGNYNGFQTGLRIQNRWGLSGEVDYTYSHEIDITSTDDSGIDNPFNIKYMKGSGGFDRRTSSASTTSTSCPSSRQPGFTHSVLGGWEVAGTVIDETGVPTTPRISSTTTGWPGRRLYQPSESIRQVQEGREYHTCL